MASVGARPAAFRVPRRIGGAPRAGGGPRFGDQAEYDRQPPAETVGSPSSDPLEAAVAEAREQGYRDGFGQGRADGLQAGREEGVREGRQAAEREVHAALDPQLARVRSLCGALTQPFAALRRTLSEAVVDGAQRLASRMVGEAVTAADGALTRTVSDILNEVSAMEGGRQRLEVRVPPQAVAPVRELIDEALGKRPEETGRAADVTVVADSRLATGDMQAVLVPASGDTVHRIEWDARLEERWSSIRTQLGLTTR